MDVKGLKVIGGTDKPEAFDRRHYGKKDDRTAEVNALKVC